MAHMQIFEDESGDAVDGAYYCSDHCHRESAGKDYRGWNGCVELGYTQTCENEGCEDIVYGLDFPGDGTPDL